MTMGIIYSGEIDDTDGVVTLPGHTYEIYLINKDYNGWVQVKLNGGPHNVFLPDAQGHSHPYVKVPGDYTKVQVMTAGATIAIYAIG